MTPAPDPRESNETGATPSGAEPAQLRQERDDLYDRLARATAEFRNMQKRLQAETEQAIAYANSALIKSLLPVIDNFERALAVETTQPEAASLKRGMQIVHDQWMRVLEAQEVEAIAPEPGTPFDPARHQAIVQEPSGQYKEPTVMRLLQKGYALHGRTLRPAQVAVSA